MNKFYVVGHAKTNIDNPITKKYIRFFLVFIIEKSSNKILNLEVSSMLEITNSYLKELFIGRNFLLDRDSIIKDIETYYLGNSQKSIIVAYKDAIKKYTISKN